VLRFLSASIVLLYRTFVEGKLDADAALLLGSSMDDFNTKENEEIPWGKYTYTLEGLARECYLEGAVKVDVAARPGAPHGKRLRFRVELPERCFILSIAIKLPNAPVVALKALDDISIERTLRSADYELVHDGVLSAPPVPLPSEGVVHESPTAVDETAQTPSKENPRKKVLEIRRAADSLRITLADIDPTASDFKMRDFTDSDSNEEEAEVAPPGEIRKLVVAVIGYVRGQTPVKSRIKILLASATKMGFMGALADRAEIDGLLGLAFLGNKRYRQAGELLERASLSVRKIAIMDQKKGFAGDVGFVWAAELNLLAAHAYFEHEPRANDGIARLVAIVKSSKPKASAAVALDYEAPRRATGFLDLRTELLRITEPLMEKLVSFLGDSSSLAVQMASARMIEFVGQQLGCAIAPYIGNVLDQVLRAYPECKPLSPRDKAAAESFSYDSMEDCYEKLVDICCRLLPLTEHSVLQRILEQTLIPVLDDAFDETEYLLDSDNVEDDADDLLCQAVSQTLRLTYLVLTILGGDAKVPPQFVTKLLDMLIAEDGRSKTPMLLRRSALHTWDAMAKSFANSCTKLSVKEMKDHINVQGKFLPRMISLRRRRAFLYNDGDDYEVGYAVRNKRSKQAIIFSENLKTQLEKMDRRFIIVDRHTLRRLLRLMTESFSGLIPLSDDDERHTASVAMTKLIRVLNESTADLFLSTLMDISYFAAVSSNVGPDSNLDYLEYRSFSTHMKVCLELFEDLLSCYWAAIRLLPPKVSEDTESNFLSRSLLTWCTYKMREAAPPRDMLRLILVAVRSFQNDYSFSFKQDYSVYDELSPLELYRANNIWLAHASYSESLDVHDALCPVVAKHLMAKDILDVIDGLGNQDGELEVRAFASSDVLAAVVANTIPALPEKTKKSLHDVVDQSIDEPRIVEGFPKSSTGGGGTKSRKLRFASTEADDNDPMVGSLYIHIVLASCFDKFDSLNKAGTRRGSGLCMANYLDSFIEHAAFLVKSLVHCAKRRKHREYIGHSLGDILRTCLNMQSHGDGRVRLAGFEIFASALNVLFLADNTNTTPVDALATDAIGLGTLERAASIGPNVSVAQDSVIGSVKELDSGDVDAKSGDEKGGSDADANDDNQSVEEDDKMAEIYTKGGSCVFYSSASSSSDLSFEERGWHMLCTFMSSSLGIGRYSDFVVHRACLEYLRGCILNSLRGKSTGVSVISFFHVESIWEAVLRLVGSPVHSLNGLALWVICATINVGVYSAVMAKGRGESRQRAGKLEEFVTNKLFVTSENFIKGGSKEMRIWGGRLLEVYIRARNMNPNTMEICPPPSKKVLLALQVLQSDWDEDARNLAKSLLNIHLEAPAKKPSTPSSITDRASTFFGKGRFGGGTEGEDESNPNLAKIELWFPALPMTSSIAEMERFGKTLEAFANSEVVGGEEVDPIESDCGSAESEYNEESVNYEEEEEEEENVTFGRISSLDSDAYNNDDEQVAEERKEVVPVGAYEEEEEGDDMGEENSEGHVNGDEPVDESGTDENLKPMDTENIIVENAQKPIEEVPVEKPPSPKMKPADLFNAGDKNKARGKEGKTLSPNSRGKKSMEVVGNVAKEADDLELEGLDDFDDLGFDGLGATVIDDEEGEELDADPNLEKMPSLPRVGSFMGRKSQAVNAEGEGISLQRRKSFDVRVESIGRKRSDEEMENRHRVHNDGEGGFSRVGSLKDDKPTSSIDELRKRFEVKGKRGVNSRGGRSMGDNSRFSRSRSSSSSSSSAKSDGGSMNRRASASLFDGGGGDGGDGSDPQGSNYANRTSSGDDKRRSTRRINSEELLPADLNKDKDTE